MAHLRNNQGEIIKGQDGLPRKTTTSGETKAREIREKEAKKKTSIRQQNAFYRKKRSPEQQLEVLDRRLGKGLGAKKERAKLLKLLEQETVSL